EDLVISVPPGTQVFDILDNKLLLDLVEEGSEILFLKGGKGGLGNVHFKSSTNQIPNYAQKGLCGLQKQVRLDLKLIADVGLVGFPNVGKSTLVSVLSNAKPEIANYEFTTLIPCLGIVDVGDYQSFVMADIPGIISGASEGKGLGLEFLRHIERTKFLLFVLDVSSYYPLQKQFEILRKEIESFSQILSKRPYGIMFSKIDSLQDENLVGDFLKIFDFALEPIDSICWLQPQEYFEKEHEGKPSFAIGASSVDRKNLKKLKSLLYQEIRKDNAKRQNCLESW
ncbi:MAG: 50S ribosome-binding GTPase, partial [Helicobacter sp.]|nr:50S ribosome-binding GTPase [Helicobacter sp.]